MKRLIVAAMALCLAACTTTGVSLPTSPAAVADTTTLDEEGLLRLERLYKATRTAVEMAADARLFRGAVAARIALGDRRAFQLLAAARAAYDTGNAATYQAALANAEAAILTIFGDK